jgi:cytochrome c-type biogenesis protein CcmH/NrfG
MGWLFVLGFTIVALGLLWRFAKLPRAGIELMLAAAFVGIAGYAWQGSPGEAGAPVPPRASEMADPDVAAVASRRAMMGRFGNDAQVVEFADTLDRLGLTQEAVIAVRTAIRKSPNSVDLWVALGNTLVVHGGGVLSPASEFAFRRGAELNPAHPAPPFFLGLALAQSGKLEAAAQVWGGLLARTPPDAPWRADLEARIGELRSMPPPAAGPPLG